MAAILGKKLGMTQIFTEDGDRVPVTVIEAGPCPVTQVKTSDRDGYAALQIGFGDIKERRVNRPKAGHFKKAGVKATRHLAEIRVDLEEAAAWLTPPAAEEQKKAKAEKKAKAKAKEEKAKETEAETEAEAEEAAEAAAEETEAGAEGEAAQGEEEAEAQAEAEEPQEEPEPAGAPGTGYQVTVAAFEAGQKVKISGVSKGKGFAGVIKRHNFAGGPGSHGAHFHRAPGSVGASAYPARVFKGLRLPGQMGNKKSTQRGLTVVGTDSEQNLLFIKGSVPGGNNGIIFIQTES